MSNNSNDNNFIDLLGEKTAKASSSLVGTIFDGKYQIEERIGQGGMAVVYRAKHIFMERLVAIKFLRGDYLNKQLMVDRFKQEARAAGRIQHPNAVSIIDFGVTVDNTFYLVMEYLEGRTLRRHIRNEGPLSAEETLSTLSQVCDAIEAAHVVGVVHRDLKPDNIFLQVKDEVEIVKVLDFGIAKIMQSDPNTGLTGTGMVMGTPQYMSPEQCEGKSPTPATDIYSLGIIAFEMLVGIPPFSAESSLAIAIKHLNENPPGICEFRPDLSESVETVILRALAKDPNKRQKSAQLFIKELRQALGLSSNTPMLGVPAAVCSNPRCNNSKPGKLGRCISCASLLVDILVRGRYRIKKVVGKGGFGITYLVMDQDCFNEARILKELRYNKPKDKEENESSISIGNSSADSLSVLSSQPESGSGINEQAERLFEREAKVLLDLQHPGIPKLHAYFVEGGCSYLVQDFIPGQTLLKEIRERKKVFNEQEARTALSELADILEYLHNQTPPIVHRDVKPQNLMRHANNRLMLIDFGAVCQAVSDPNSRRTLIGSPGYAPPEQIIGQPVPQSDLYAAGATIIYLVSGIHPSQYFNIQTQQIEWDSKINLSSQFTELLKDLLCEDVKKRVSSATELKQRLHALDTEPSVDNGLSLTTEQFSKLFRTESLRFSSPLKNQQSLSVVLSTVPDPNLQKSPAQNSVETIDETGSLEQSPIFVLLSRFWQKALTGVLTCINDTEIKTVFFDKGTIVFASSTVLLERLGEMLLRIGRINSSEFEQASTLMQSRGVAFGAALIEIGAIKPEELNSLIAIQVSNIVYSLFDWSTGQYEVRNSLPKPTIKLFLSTSEIILEGLRRMKNIEIIRKWFITANKNIVRSTKIAPLEQKLTSKEVNLLTQINHPMSFQECLAFNIGSETESIKILSGLLIIGALEWSDVKLEVVDKRNSTDSNKIEQMPSFDIQAAAMFCHEVENKLSTIKDANYFFVLGVKQTANDFEIEKAYKQLSERFDPNNHKQLTNYNQNLKNDLEKLFSVILEAYKILKNPSSRSEYEQRQRSIGNATGSFKFPTLQIPKTVEVGEKLSAKELFSKGLDYYKGKAYEKASRLFKLALAKEPKEVNYRLHLARSLLMQDYLQEAEQQFHKVIDLSPKTAEYYLELGLLYQKMKKSQQAYEVFDKVLKIIPNNSLASRLAKESRRK